MKKFLLIIVFTLFTLYANEIEYIDEDLDGVVDSYDKCLNTPFEYEVNEDGCPKELQSEEYKYRVDFAYTYSKQSAATYSYDYSAKELSAYLETNRFLFGVRNSFLDIYYNDKTTNTLYNEQGYSDLSLELGYKFNYEYLYSVNFITKFATASNSSLSSGKNDYSVELNFNKSLKDIYFFSYISYNILGDGEIEYYNYFNCAFGAMKALRNDVYIATNLYYTQPIVAAGEDEVDLQLLLNFSYDLNYQFNLVYTTNIRNRDSLNKDALSLRFGYTF